MSMMSPEPTPDYTAIAGQAYDETIPPASVSAPEDPEDSGVEDFDAFWSARKRKHPALRIFGQLVQLPASLPLQFEMEARKLERSKNDQDVRKLVAILFGEGAMEGWAAAGMDLEQFQVLLLWAPRRITGDPITLQQAADEVAARTAAADRSETDGGPDPT